MIVGFLPCQIYFGLIVVQKSGQLLELELEEAKKLKRQISSVQIISDDSMYQQPYQPYRNYSFF